MNAQIESGNIPQVMAALGQAARAAADDLAMSGAEQRNLALA